MPDRKRRGGSIAAAGKGIWPRIAARLIGAKQSLVKVLPRLMTKPALLLLVVALIFAVTTTLPKPSTMFVLTARIESMDVRVVHADAARFALENAWSEATNACMSGVEVVIEHGGVVTYSRKMDGPLYISIRGSSYWTSADEVVHQSVTDARFVIGDPDLECGGSRWIRLPANGLATVGIEGSVPASGDDLLLLDGNLRLFNRALERLFGGISLDWGPFTANSLYLAAEIPIPSGSRIDKARNLQSTPAVWSGTVSVDMSAGGEPAMSVEMASNAQSVELWAPAIFEPSAPSAASEDSPAPGQIPDVIALSLGSRLSSDPNLRWLFGLIGAFSLILGILGEAWNRT